MDRNRHDISDQEISGAAFAEVEAVLESYGYGQLRRTQFYATGLMAHLGDIEDAGLRMQLSKAICLTLVRAANGEMPE
jgi:hypothetical protein